MTKEEAWLFWMNNNKTTDAPVETDFLFIKRSSHWTAFEAGWDAANADSEAFNKGHEMGRATKKEWSGLTDEEFEQLLSEFGDDPRFLAVEIEIRLMERNT